VSFDPTYSYSADTAGQVHDPGAGAAEPRAIQGEESWWLGDLAGERSVLGYHGPVSARAALSLTSILAAVIVLATDVALLPVNVYRRRPDGGKDYQVGHPVEELLTVSPDGETTPFNWTQSLVGHAALWGTGYSEIQRLNRGTPYALHLLEPAGTSPYRQEGKLRYRIGNGDSLLHENVLRIAGFGHNGLTGYNLVNLSAQAIRLGLQMQAFSLDYFENGAQPGVILEAPAGLSKEAMRELREGWDQFHQGAGKRFRTAVLKAGAKASTLAAKPDEAQILEGRKFLVNDTARPWRVPPHKYGDFSQAHLANIEASNIDYLTTTLSPWLVALAQEYNLKLFSKAERRAGFYVEHNVNALLRGDIRSRFEAYGKALTDGWLNRDEVRARENLNPIGDKAGGNKHLVGLNQTTLANAGHMPAPSQLSQREGLA
jgi:HK97 family phage portal protein